MVTTTRDRTGELPARAMTEPKGAAARLSNLAAQNPAPVRLGLGPCASLQVTLVLRLIGRVQSLTGKRALVSAASHSPARFVDHIRAAVAHMLQHLPIAFGLTPRGEIDRPRAEVLNPQLIAFFAGNMGRPGV